MMSVAQRVASYTIFVLFIIVSVSRVLVLPMGWRFWFAVVGATVFSILLVVSVIRDLRHHDRGLL